MCCPTAPIRSNPFPHNPVKDLSVYFVPDGLTISILQYIICVIHHVSYRFEDVQICPQKHTSQRKYWLMLPLWPPVKQAWKTATQKLFPKDCTAPHSPSCKTIDIIMPDAQTQCKPQNGLYCVYGFLVCGHRAYLDPIRHFASDRLRLCDLVIDGMLVCIISFKRTDRHAS